MKEESKDLLDMDSEELYEHYRIVTDPKQQLIRIDKFLMDRLPNVTRNKLQQAIKDGFVMVNNQNIKPNYKIRPFDEIIISLPEPPRDTEVIPENIPLNIVYEDEYLLVVNKDAGMVVHPAYNNWNGTLVNALAYHFKSLPELKNNEGRPGLVHRIDKDTSGLLVIAKTEEVINGLAAQFARHSTERTYYALIWGTLEPQNGTIDIHIGRSPKDRRVMIGYPEGNFGKNAITHFKLIEDLRYVSLVQCNLETGRTHQIRAHMKHIGHPLFNDATYGGDQILKGTQFSKYKAFVENCFKLLPGQALHAKSLGFVHPITKEQMHFDSELPNYFNDLIDKWRNYINYH